MRVILSKGLLAIGVVALVMAGCSSSDSTDTNTLPVEEWDLTGVALGNGVYPEGTIGYLSEDRGTLQSRYPDGVLRVNKLVDGKFRIDVGDCYQCESTCTGGCDVVNLGGSIGCSSCPKGSTATCTGSYCTNQNSVIEGFGFVDVAAGISFAEGTEISSRISNSEQATWEMMMAVPEIQAEFDAFMEDIWAEAPTEKSLLSAKSALVNAFGIRMVLKVPADYQAKGNLMYVEPGDVSCNCSSGNSGCTHEEVRKMGMHVGDKCIAGGCTTCQMVIE